MPPGYFGTEDQSNRGPEKNVVFAIRIRIRTRVTAFFP